MVLAFRNLDITPEQPVEHWPSEAVLAALERGGLGDWRRLIGAIEREPWGPVARRVEQALVVSRPYGVAELMERAIARSRRAAAEAERGEVVMLIGKYLRRSGFTQAQFAERIGTSASRLSTYLSGKVAPSSTLLMRMRRVGRSASWKSAPADR